MVNILILKHVETSGLATSCNDRLLVRALVVCGKLLLLALGDSRVGVLQELGAKRRLFALLFCWRKAFGVRLLDLSFWIWDFGVGLLALGLWCWAFGIGCFTLGFLRLGFLVLVFWRWSFCVEICSCFFALVRKVGISC